MVPSRTEGIDLEGLAGYLAEPLGLSGEPLEADLIEGGRSNLTYILRQGDRSWVLRRPPLGRRQPTAHDMGREYRVLDGLDGTAVPVPTPLALCRDESVIGAEFYVMERVEGRILRAPADVDLGPEEARRCSFALVDTLAAIHRTDFEAAGLGDLGRPDGYLRRQVSRWTGQLDSGIRVSPGLRELSRRLAASVPERDLAGLVHGDFRMDNVVLDPEDPGRVIAVLDWEMATLGDPLADLGMLLMYWRRPGERCAAEAHEITTAEGFIERPELAARYGERTGFDLTDLDFFEVLAHFKLAVIVEGIHARNQAGDTVGDSFEQIESIPASLVETALELAESSNVPGLNGRTA
ncbi:MAG: phosphotransferase family protein [Solirubrobacterales bacterium]|nr:phosphotransferase family protein [Solirubrobacterales bacterium]